MLCTVQSHIDYRCANYQRKSNIDILLATLDLVDQQAVWTACTRYILAMQTHKAVYDIMVDGVCLHFCA